MTLPFQSTADVVASLLGSDLSRITGLTRYSLVARCVLAMLLLCTVFVFDDDSEAKAKLLRKSS